MVNFGQPNATLKVYDGALHGMCTTLKDRVNADLRDFVTPENLSQSAMLGLGKESAAIFALRGVGNGGLLVANICSCSVSVNRSRRRDQGSFVTAGEVLCDRLLDRIRQILITNRFGQELDRAGIHGQTDIGTCACPLMKIIGKRKSAVASSS